MIYHYITGFTHRINRTQLSFINTIDIFSYQTFLSRYQPWRRSGVFIVNFEHISHPFLNFILLTLNRQLFAGILALLKLEG